MQQIPLRAVWLTGLAFILLSACSWAQTDQYIISRQGSVTLLPVYESWKDDAGFHQTSTLLSIYLPVSRTMSFSVRGGGAAATGDIADLSGFSDVQIGWNYFIEPANTILSLGINAPTGKTELSADQFTSSVLLSNSLFDLQVPVLGQGFNINPGVAWVFPVSDEVVLGLAGGYQYRGPYKPRTGDPDYDPGDEITASVGIDFRLSESVSVSTDFVFTHYTTDTFGGTKVFASGNSYWINGQYKQYFSEDELLVFVGYRTKSKGQIQGAGGLVDEKERLEPGRLDVQAEFHQVFNRQFTLGYQAEARIFETTAVALSGAKVYGVGVAPTFTFGGQFSILVRLLAQFGSLKDGKTITGFDAGAGLAVGF
jgi:hypothetical protein